MIFIDFYWQVLNHPKFPNFHAIHWSIFMWLVFLQADRGTRQPLSRQYQHQAAGVGDPLVHRQTRDLARPWLLRQLVCVLQRRQRQPSHPSGGQRQATAEREVHHMSHCLTSTVVVYPLILSRSPPHKFIIPWR